MEERSLATIKSMFQLRKIGSETMSFEPVAGQLDETRMFSYAGILIIFSEKTRVTEKELNNFIKFADDGGYKSGIIIVTPTAPSENVMNVLRNYIADKDHQLVQVFEIRHLQLDIAKHRKVPKHQIITDDERVKLFKTLYIDIDTTNLSSVLPKIDSQDPMAKWIGARPGDIVKVTGLCESSGLYVRYRQCVTNVYDS